MAIADLNGDRKLDIVVTNACGATTDCSHNGSLGVLLGNGDGTFQAPVPYDVGAMLPASTTVADLNMNGKPDLLVANKCASTGSCTQGTLAVLLGKGDGIFRTAVLYDSGGDSANSVAIADVNGDGKVDALVSNFCPTSSNGHCAVGTPGIVGVLLGNGDGTFAPALTFPAGGYWGAASIAAADVNADNRTDVIVANLFGSTSLEGSVGVLVNNSPSCATPPAVTVSITPAALWPANGKMVPVIVSGTITDTGCTITSAAYAVKDEYGLVQPSGTVTLRTQGGQG